jgi:hypothetical protein
VDGTGSGSCPMAGFGISGVEPWGSATRVSQLVFGERFSVKDLCCPHLCDRGSS